MTIVRLPFVKMESLGNSYLFVTPEGLGNKNRPYWAKIICNFSTGLGGDGMIVIDHKKEPFMMEIYNRDGSQAEICGNGLRQAALLLRHFYYPRRRFFCLHPPAGVFEAEVLRKNGRMATVLAPLGRPDFRSSAVGLSRNGRLALAVAFNFRGKKYFVDCVSMGNPHAVIIVKNYDFEWQEIGRFISTNPRFRRGVNVHFMRLTSRRRFQMRIFERGSEVTSACASGAAACLAVGVMRGLLDKKAVAEMPGGKLALSWDFTTGQIAAIGPARIIGVGDFLL